MGLFDGLKMWKILGMFGYVLGKIMGELWCYENLKIKKIWAVL